MAASNGNDPLLPDSKSGVLPLYYEAIFLAALLVVETRSHVPETCAMPLRHRAKNLEPCRGVEPL